MFLLGRTSDRLVARVHEDDLSGARRTLIAQSRQHTPIACKRVNCIVVYKIVQYSNLIPMVHYRTQIFHLGTGSWLDYKKLA